MAPILENATIAECHTVTSIAKRSFLSLKIWLSIIHYTPVCSDLTSFNLLVESWLRGGRRIYRASTVSKIRKPVYDDGVGAAVGASGVLSLSLFFLAHSFYLFHKMTKVVNAPQSVVVEAIRDPCLQKDPSLLPGNKKKVCFQSQVSL